MDVVYVWGLAGALGAAALAATLKVADLVFTLAKEREDNANFREQVETRIAASVMKVSATVRGLKEERDRLATRVRELEREIERLKDWSTEKELYTRTEIAKGLYALLETDSSGDITRDFESAYKLCDACFARDVKSPLAQKIDAGGRRILVCRNCGEFRVPKYLDTDRQVANDVS